MERNCNLELRLASRSDYDQNHHHVHLKPMLVSSKEREKQRQLTVFYNGRVSICNVTEIQARAIIMLASHAMEEKLKNLLGSEPSSPLRQSRSCSLSTGLSMKRSLQRFLQKRRNRIQATPPYNHKSL